MKILVAMSGGVDSSVVAHLLKEQGHDLIGVMMKLWTDPLAPTVRRALPTKCCSVEHIQRARSVCQTLDIPFYVLNLEEEFKEHVVDPFLKDYEEGKTPNPCINCNRTIKFGTLLEKMKELDCEKLATGHYARVAEEKTSDGKTRHLLLTALDHVKDQSYYLYSLTQDQLQHVLFPLGSMQKSDVFKCAKHYRIDIPDYYRESQDLCFFPEKEPTKFLQRYIDTTPGAIKTVDGKTVGTHKGLPFYTIGQRKGLNIGGLKIPLHVVSKEQKSNTIFVAPDGEDLKSELSFKNCHWISIPPETGKDIPFEARISSLGTRYRGALHRKGETASFVFSSPVRGIAEGQSIVLYRGEEVVGGGVICR